MISRNDLIEYTVGQLRVIRVLWINAAHTAAYVFDVSGKSAEAQLIRIAMLEADLASGRARPLARDPWPQPALASESLHRVPAKHLELRTRAWNIVRDLVAQEPAIYESRKRGPLVQACMERHGVSHPTVYRYLRRYWQRGMTPDALLPDYANSGGKGKVRAVSEGIQRGRPRKEGAPPGVNADAAMRRVFHVAATRHADGAIPGATPQSRRHLYEQMVRDFYYARRYDAYSQRVQRGQQMQALPSFGQFSYWLEQDRALARPYAAPALPAATDPGRPGRPGAAFRLEAVLADVRLVSRADRSQLLGRPVVYIVTDVFSGMVTGMYVGLAPADWQHALLALANCVADKQRWCARHGREIASGLWPAQHLPALLWADPALIDGDSAQGEPAGAGSPHHAALLEQFKVRCLPDPCGQVVAGGGWRAELARRVPLMATDVASAIDTPRNDSLDGVLDAGQFTRLVIDSVLHFNHRRQAQGSDAGWTPHQLWQWGVQQRGSALHTEQEDLVRCRLLPVAAALVTAQGIRVQGSHYDCLRAQQENWFERAAQHGQWPVQVAYDPACVETVYLLDPRVQHQYHACRLAGEPISGADIAAERDERELSSIERARLRAAQARPQVDTKARNVVFERIVAALAG